jgi:hypothetical protein
MKNNSKKHHYLPVFYLKGFANSEGKLFVYNKLTDTILENIDPSSIFFEKNLNNFFHEGKSVLSLEDDFFNEHDSRASIFLRNYLADKLIFSEEESVEYQYQLTWFLINLFWRIPNSNKHFEEIIARDGIHHKYFQIVNSSTNEAAPQHVIDEIQHDVLNRKENRKVFKLVYPFASLQSGEVKRIMERSKDYSIFGNYSLITGDNPFVSTSRTPNIDNVLGEFLFPFSYNRLLVAADKTPKFVNMHLLMNLNITILHQSQRFVCSHDLENLKYMVRFYKIYRVENLLDHIIEKTFALLSEMCDFKSLDEFVQHKNQQFRKMAP